jgi:hypothetical protein
MANERKPEDRGPEDVERELEADQQRHEQGRARLVGDMAQDRNLSGSTTWETIAAGEADGGEGKGEGDAKGGEERSSDRAAASRPEGTDANPPRTTSGGITAPKFGSAGSGGAELEPGPERD